MLFPAGFDVFLKGAAGFIGDWWWVFTPPVLLFILNDMWLLYKSWQYYLRLEFIILEVRLPQEVERTPKAMENVFSGLHGIWDEVKIIDRYTKGTLPDRVSCEMVSLNGESHFYIRLPKKYKNLVEAHVWAQYPTAEIHEAEDYTDTIPQDVPNKEWEVWGTEFVLTQPDAYPIRTYPYFEEVVEEKRLDPLSAFLEVMGSVGEGEQVWLQIVVEPIMGDAWKNEGQALVEKIIGRKPKPKPKGIIGTLSDEVGRLPGNVVSGMTTGGGVAGSKVQQKPAPYEPPSIMMHLSPGERAVVEAIEINLSKLAFRTSIRLLYLARRDVYNGATIAALFGAVRQFNTQNLNGFRPNRNTLVKRFYIFEKERKFFRKRRLLRFYRLRWHGLKSFIFNIEELATIYHFPGRMLAPAPLVPRIEAKRGEPPLTLPRA